MRSSFAPTSRSRGSGSTLIQTDVASLASELRERIDGEVRFDAGSRALYATDGSNYRQPPIGVVIPRTRQDVIETVALCRSYGVPVLGRGCGTSLAGQTCNVAVILDMSKYLNRILELNPEQRYARVEPGLILDNLRTAAEAHHLTFAPDPATHTHNTLGGMIGNNSCGVHSVMGGRTSDNIIELEVLTYEGEVLKVGATPADELDRIIAGGGARAEIYHKLRDLRDRYAEDIRRRFPDIPRRVSGFNLPDLLPEKGFNVARALVGSESTCVLVLEAKVSLVPSPPHRSLLVLGYPDVYGAGDHVPDIMAFNPTACEGLDQRLVDDMRAAGIRSENTELLPEGNGWLIVELGGDSADDAERRGQDMMAELKQSDAPPSMALFSDPQDQERIWKVREAGLAATAHVPGEPLTWPGWEDSAVAPERVGQYLRALRGLLEKYGYGCDLYGHFGQGCIHTRIDFDLTSAQGIARYRAFLEEAAKLVVSMGGTFSGEHGDGQARGELLPIMFGDSLMQAFREFKAIWDPLGKMNPGKVVEPNPLDENLRLGARYAPPPVDTHFKYPEDGGSFSHALLRCVGIGKCRREDGGTMCPSFMVTHEEKHSTRGRARLLFEMLQGDVIRDGWKEEAVKDALDLCLSCKGCKGDCPVNVDMATYKAEFLAHYYDGRVRPRSAYAFGFIDRWAWLASKSPRLVNFLTQSRGLEALAKATVDVPLQRHLPRFASETFQSWFRKRNGRRPSGPRVIVWPDTFNNYLKPNTAKAAVGVLEDAGFQVVVPGSHLCCGRPLYEWGMLDRAKQYLHKVMHVLRDEIAAGTPIIGLEPACVSVFTEELPNLFPGHKAATRLSRQLYLLSDFLLEQAPHYQPPSLRQHTALVHAHCHHKSLYGVESLQQILDRAELDYRMPETGCCGMAGSFGMEKGNYEVSVACAERALLPAIRDAGAATLIMTDGFSCRQQIEDLAGTHALHLADVLWHGIEQRNLAGNESIGT